MCPATTPNIHRSIYVYFIFVVIFSPYKRTILKEKFSVRDLEKMLAGRTSTSSKPTTKTTDERNLESALSSKLGSKVVIQDKDGKGKMVIKYYSYDELDGIIEKISV